jgi:hypothetical protein
MLRRRSPSALKPAPERSPAGTARARRPIALPLVVAPPLAARLLPRPPSHPSAPPTIQHNAHAETPRIDILKPMKLYNFAITDNVSHRHTSMRRIIRGARPPPQL